MKKLLPIILIILAVFSLVSCGKKCEECGGTGNLPCENMILYKYFDRVHDNNCPLCHGTTIMDCESCDGTGKG